MRTTECFTTPDPVGFSACSCSEVVVFSASFQTASPTPAMRPRLALASEYKSRVGSVAEADKLRARNDSI